ncbi:MAG: hypothetical protein Q8922_06550 [Bacteroidota bacterium]|nr:hypothetical protein [Bacteroidota bacterium]MDP4232745.1 hypothetical protein [Bacteroidota bacterium]MDP4244061.1 hypothetical protein [Bacteroidota bacterium]MDP4287579.1 hypothetical protein [Bacteroidota bacterium]
MPRLTIATGLLAAAMLSSCGTVFHGKPRLEIVGPRDAYVEDMGGNKLPTYQNNDDSHGVYVDRKRSDSVRIAYAGKETSVALVKQVDVAELFNTATLGVGFVLDDLTNTWFDYAPIYVTIDSNRVHGLQSVNARSDNWFGESRFERSLYFLLTGGTGVTFVTDGGSALQKGSTTFPALAFQAGLGLDYDFKLEAYILTRAEWAYPISTEQHPETASLTTLDFCLRYFFAKHYYLQGAIGSASASQDAVHYQYVPLDSQDGAGVRDAGFNEAGVSLGWAGDVSFVSLQYFQGLTPFDLSHSANVRYHTLYLDFGLNLRL